MSALVILALGCGESTSGSDAAAPTPGDAAGDVGRDADAEPSARDGAPEGRPRDAARDTGADAGVDAAAGRFEEVLAILERDRSDASALDALMHEVAWTDGWPLREGDRYLFLTRWDEPGGPVSWVGAFNGWSPGSQPAARLSTGVHYWVLVTTDQDAAGAGYKWHAAAAPEVWRPPPEATRYEYDEFGEMGLVAAPRDRPWLERFPALTTPRMPAPRTVRVRVPAGFERGPRRTLLLHDGQNVFGPEGPFGGWQVDAALTGPFADVLAIAVDNAPDRMEVYTHVPDVVGATTVGGRAADYLALLEEEVLPFVRARYGVEARGDAQMVAGSSLGGLVTLYLAIERPGLAGCVAGLSSTLGWGAFGRAGADSSETLLDLWESRLPVAVYLDSGGGVRGGCADFDGDGVHEDSDDRDNYCTTVQMRDHLRGLGYVEGRDLFYRWEPGASHDEAAWRARFPGALEACAVAGWRLP